MAAKMEFKEGKTVAVTGASQGIGLEFCRQLLAKGCTVIATARTPDGAPDLKALAAEQHPGLLHVTQLDVADPASIAAWAAGLRGACGGNLRHVDVLINNAGVYGPKRDVRSITSDDMVEVFRTNAVGPLLVVQALLQEGLLGGTMPGGRSLVANVSSKVGSVADNRSGGGYAYRASKSALNIITASLAIDLGGADTVACTLLHPGYVRTSMTGGQGLIDVDASVAGMLGVLERYTLDELNGSWRDYKDEVVPW